MALNDRQQRFVDEYVIDHNATQAAIRAKYSKKTCGAKGHSLLKNVEISASIAEKEAKMQEEVGFSAKSVLKELSKLVHFDPKKLYDERGNLKEIRDLDDDTASALIGLEVIETKSGIYDELKTTRSRTKKLKWHDKNAAIVTAMRHFGMLKDKYEHTGANGADLIPKDDPVDTARRVAFLLAQGIAEQK